VDPKSGAAAVYSRKAVEFSLFFLLQLLLLFEGVARVLSLVLFEVMLPMQGLGLDFSRVFSLSFNFQLSPDIEEYFLQSGNADAVLLVLESVLLLIYFLEHQRKPSYII
jgi:hypothetical protein